MTFSKLEILTLLILNDCHQFQYSLGSSNVENTKLMTVNNEESSLPKNGENCRDYLFVLNRNKPMSLTNYLYPAKNYAKICFLHYFLPLTEEDVVALLYSV